MSPNADPPVLTARDSRGVVTLAAELRNQRGEVTQEGEFVELIMRTPITVEPS